MNALEWTRIRADLDESGVARMGEILTPTECRAIAEMYQDKARFRSHISMARHGFGSGEYKYFDYPLPDPVGPLRKAIYPHLATIANGWAEALGQAPNFSADLEGMLARSHAAGQVKATPLLLSYTAGDYNCLHQDLYGEVVFPLQVVILLS